MVVHKYELGEIVEFLPGRLDASVPRGDFAIARLLPSETRDHQYRIRHLRDQHERVVWESQLRRR